MNTINNLTSSLIGNQLPSFIANEYPLFVDFIQTYYQGLERSGESLDLVNNLLTYLDVDFYQNQINYSCILQNNIDENDTTIVVDSTAGFPDVDGLIQIDSEIILYKSKTDTEFLFCNRAVSGVTSLGNTFTYSYSSPSSHTSNSVVTNLSYLFILYFFTKIKNEYLPYFNRNFTSGLNLSTFIKNIKEFYNAKGTSKSFDFLIRAFFNEDNATLYPKENLIKPSDAIFYKKNLLVCKAVSGNPIELIGQELVQTKHGEDPCGDLTKNASLFVESVETKFTSTEQIFEITIANSFSGNQLLVTPKTKLIDTLNSVSTIITVDSTVGFEKTGYLKINNELIKYTDKTLNQFLGCTRGYCNTTSDSYEISTEITSTLKCYGYSNVDNSLIEVDVLGVSKNVTITDSSQDYFFGDKVLGTHLGFSKNDPLTKSWIFNSPKLLSVKTVTNSGNVINIVTEFPHGLYVGDQVTVYGFNVNDLNGIQTVSTIINEFQFSYTVSSLSSSNFDNLGYIAVGLKKKGIIPADITNVYDYNSESLYVASSGCPSYSIGSGITLGNQRYLKKITRFPVSPNTKTPVSNESTLGVFVNGVLGRTYKSKNNVTYGEVTQIRVDNGGSGYGIGVSGGPSITISNGTGVTATATCTINGSLERIYVVNNGSGFVSKPEITISGGGGNGAKAEAFVSNGSIIGISVISSGTGYTSLPTISISGGGGTGAVLSSRITGPIQSINLTNTGTGYTSVPYVTINLGGGAQASPIISNGQIKDVALIASGGGYNCPPKVFVNDSTGKGQGAEIIANTTNGKVTSFTIINSGINYTPGFTTISIVPLGSGSILTPLVRTWTFNSFVTESLDENNAIIKYGDNLSYGLEYSYLGNPKNLRKQVSDNINSDLSEPLLPNKHSTILGWAYDGNPIYGPYGYISPLDLASGFKRIVSGYTLKSSRTNGPSTSTYPLGTFVEDYEYTASGDLDQYNGRYCVTPEFPQGTYAYFLTINSSGVPQFPYIIGNSFYGNPDPWNLDNTQSIQDNLPSGVLRYRDPYLNIDIDYTRKIVNQDPFFFLQEDGISYILQEDNLSYIESEPSISLYDYFPRSTQSPILSVVSTERTSKATIDGFYIESGGQNYKVNDKLTFTPVDSGYGASAKVSYISGQSITSVQSNQYKKIKYSSLFGNFANLTKIIGLTSGAGATVAIVDSLNSTIYANVYTGSFVVGENISLDYSSVSNSTIFTGTGQTIGSGYTSYTLSNAIVGITPTITLNTGTGVTIGSNLLLDNEIVKVFSGAGNTFSVFRGQFGTDIVGHNSGISVFLLPTIPVTNSSIFEVGNYLKCDNEIFRLVDINNSGNSLTLLRNQLGSSLASHGAGTTIYKVSVPTAVITSVQNGYTVSIGTGSSNLLNYGDNVIVSSNSQYDSVYTGIRKVIFANNSSFVYETSTLGAGNSSPLSYITDSVTAFGSIARIQLNSGGTNYKILPYVNVNSFTGFGASIVALSSTSGKINTLSIDNSGYGLNPDYTLKPELEFPKTLKLKNTLSVESIQLIDGGSGYQYTPIVEIIGGGGSGAAAQATVVNQKVSSIVLTNHGSGYNTTPTVNIKKSFPCYINTFNSTLNFSFSVSGTINTGDPVTIYSDGTYPIIYGGLSISPTLKFYAIVGGGLDSNQIQLALSYTNAVSGNYVKLVTSGTGNISLVSQSGNAIAKAILTSSTFDNGENVHQLDSANNVIAVGKVLTNFGWQESSKNLRITVTSGTFSAGYKVVGEKSKASGIINEIVNASGRIDVGSNTFSTGKFETEIGKISDRSQNIIDSDYYQDYSYILKNNVDYINWYPTLKNISHPSGFKVFGNRNVTSDFVGTGLSEYPSYITIKQEIFKNLSLSSYNSFAISGPDYTTSLKEQVTIYNRELTSSEKIISSFVNKIDDISNLTISRTGTGSANTFYLTSRIKDLVKKEDISITIDSIPQPPESYTLEFDFDINFNITAAKIVFSTNPANGSAILINCAGLNFDGINRSFPILFNGVSKDYNNNQILISLNGIIQTQSSYEISQDTQLSFTEVPSTNSIINIRKISTGSTSSTFLGTGLSTYTIGSGISNNSSLVLVDGVVQDKDAYTISGTQINFSETINSGSKVYVRSFNSAVSSREVVGVGSTTNIVPITSTISSGSTSALVSIDGIVQDSTNYTIGSGSTCIIFDDNILPGSKVYICNFGSNVSFYTRIVSTGTIADYTFKNILNSSQDDFIITLDGVLQIPGQNNSYTILDQTVKNIIFTEPPKTRTTFFGLLYNRKDPSGNTILDDLSQSYFIGTGISGTLVQNDYLQQENNGSLCQVFSFGSGISIIGIKNISGTFSVGQTVISGLASSVSTGITALVTTGSGITIGTNSFSVGNSTGFSVNDYINIDGEIMKISSISSGKTFTVSRGKVNTPVSYHSFNSLVTKIKPASFIISSKYNGFNGTGVTFTMTTNGNPYNYNGTPFALPSSSVDVYGQDYSQSLIATLNTIVQDNNSQGSFTLSGSSIIFKEPPQEGNNFYGRYIGKLRRLNDISKQFNGIKLSFNLNIGNNLIYSITSSNSSVDVSNNALVFINGVLQNPGESFVILGSRIIFYEPPKPNTTFLGYIYIGSDDDVVANNILPPIESKDKIFIEGENNYRDVLSVDSSSSLSTFGYFGEIDGLDAQAVVNVINQKVSSVTITNGGYGYFDPPAIIFQGGGGYGAQAYASVENGVITEVVVTNSGKNYVSSPRIIFARNLSLYKQQRIRREYSSDYSKITSLGTGLTFGVGTSLPATGQTVGLANTSGLFVPGTIRIVDTSRAYPVIETITYNGITGTNLTGCVRGVGFNFNKVLKVGSGATDITFGIGQTITNGTGVTGNVVKWDYSNNLLFVNRTSIPDFNNGDIIQGTGISVVDSAFIRTYLSYSSGTTVVQVN